MDPAGCSSDSTSFAVATVVANEFSLTVSLPPVTPEPAARPILSQVRAQGGLIVSDGVPTRALRYILRSTRYIRIHQDTIVMTIVHQDTIIDY